ncbi:MAG: DNA polymerase III subunit alpha [Mycoplasma sp.]|nr:DNA polymerase III subunit alpha [Mycoplasma sp.]
MGKIINLHFYSEYSFFESPTKIKEYVNFGKNNEIECLVLTDHNNIHGYAEFRKYCNVNNIKPIFGIDLDVEDIRLILLAKNNKGFSEIKNFAYQKSKNTIIKFSDISDENLFIILNPNFKSKHVDHLKSLFKDFYFYDPSNNNSNIYIRDCRILDNEHYSSLKIINEIKELKLNPENDYCYDTSVNSIDNSLLNNINEIVKQCNVIFYDKQNMLPIFCENPLNYLKTLIETRIKERKDLREYDINIVKKRIDYEFSVIKKMNVENYFLIISDLINWAKENDISIGPGRGSVSGSLISYIIGITQINPLKYNLYFERFLNEERITLPDIDIDIQDDKRENVIEYLKKKYGHEHVAQICTFQRVGSKQALKDCGKFLEINFTRMNEITKLISGSDSLKESYEKNIKFKATIDSEEILTKLYECSLLIESLPRQVGIHAAGVVLSKSKIIDSIPIMNIDNNIVTQFSMEYIEDWDLLKIDLLGLRTLTIIKKIEEEIQKTFDKNFKFDQIPLDDQKTNKLLTSAKVLGIFQLESPGMMNTLSKVKINHFNDLVDTISLFRPGPMSNIPEYIKNKNDKNNIKSICDVYDEIVYSTNGIIIYQEQIMEIIQKVAGLSFAKADILRRAISKKNRNEILEMEKTFINGAINNNISEDIAKLIYAQIVKFAEYGFNKSHAVAYATLSYRMAYLKAKFPLCFFIGIMTLTTSMDTINKLVIEAKELKFNIFSPAINKISNDISHDKKNNIYLPLTFIKGLGEVANKKILNEYNQYGKFNDFFDFVARAKKANIGDSIIDILIESNSLREFGNMNTLIQNKSKALSYASTISFEDKNTNEIILDMSVKKPKLEVYDEDLRQEAKNEIKYLGMIYNAFITSKYESNDKLSNLKVGIEYKIVLSINKKKEIMTKFKKLAKCIEVSDSSTNETIWFNEKNLNIYETIEENTIGYATILKLDRNGRTYFNIYKWEKIK